MTSLHTSLDSIGTRVRALAPSLTLPSSLLRRRSSARVIAGLDIEPGQVVAAQVHLNGGVKVERAGGVPLPSHVVRDGEVIDVEALTEALRQLFAEHKLPRDVRVGVANQRIMVRTLEFPPISDPRELDAAVRFRAQDEIPMPPETVVLDFHSLGVTETMSGPRQRVVLVAARRDMVERLLTAVRGAGLRPEGIDLAAFALIRSLYRRGEHEDEQVLYLHVSGLTNLVVARGVNCVFTRVLGTGLEAMATAVAERCVLATDDARSLLFRAGLPPRGESTAAGGSAGAGEGADADEHRPATEHLRAEESAPPSVGDDATAAESDQLAIARAVISDGLRQIIAEVRNSLDYHLGHIGTGAERGVARVVLSGPICAVPGVVDVLTGELNLPLTTADIAVTGSDAAAGVPASRLAVAAGLAVHEVAA